MSNNQEEWIEETRAYLTGEGGLTTERAWSCLDDWFGFCQSEVVSNPPILAPVFYIRDYLISEYRARYLRGRLRRWAKSGKTETTDWWCVYFLDTYPYTEPGEQVSRELSAAEKFVFDIEEKYIWLPSLETSDRAWTWDLEKEFRQSKEEDFGTGR